MFCHAHAAQAAIARCTSCGRFVCAACRRRESGRALCEPCFARTPLEKIRVWPVPPRAPVIERVAPANPAVPTLPTPSAPATPNAPAQPFVPTPATPREPRTARLPRPGVAATLGIVPGLGHLYAGSWGRGLGILLLAFPAAALSVAAGVIPAAAYAFGHGLVAFDGYRLARVRRGEWTREDRREARGVWLACAAVLVLLSAARASGIELSLWVAWPALLVPLGVGLMLGERSNRADARAEAAKAPAAPTPPALPTPPVLPTPPAPPAKPVEPRPGETVDRRMRRAALASELTPV